MVSFFLSLSNLIYLGATVWGSQFPVDYKRNQIYVATANYYKLPDLIQQCVNDTHNLTLYSDPCDLPGAYGEAVIALDMTTGIVRWSRNIGAVNGYVDGCGHPHPNCPPYPGDDTDFGQAPILKLNLTYKLGGKNRDQLFVGQKSGIAFNFDAETGRSIWSNQVAPGGNGGGMKFGSAADDQYLYVGNMNGGGLNYTLPNGTITTKASWSALDLVTGDIKWTTVDPTTNINQTSADLALTVWDQLVLVQGGSYTGATEGPIKGCLYGLNKMNGEVLYEWCIENSTIGSGASVAKNTIYVGLGYLMPRPATDGIVALQLP
jgi:polyvinyl alcohol dehydrogenase (cytochrome)